MKIENLRVNHLINPLGFSLNEPRFSWIVTDSSSQFAVKSRVEISADSAFRSHLLDSGLIEGIDSVAFRPALCLKPRTRYFWRVTVLGDKGDRATSETAWFETAKLQEPWHAIWITPDADKAIQPIVYKQFRVTKPIKSARAYVCGLGVYELYLNGQKAGDEFLAPFCNDYDTWLQYQTYELTLVQGSNNVEVMLGNGWYKGAFGLNKDKKDEVYGDKLSLILEIHVTYEDDSRELWVSDTSWKARRSQILDSSIYHGETVDATLSDQTVYDMLPWDAGNRALTARLSPPVRVTQRIRPVALITTPLGETVIDMGQNMVGFVSFINRAPKGARITLSHGEILQNGNFYRDNLRAARAEFIYISDGEQTLVRPHFTFFGFRYVKIEGLCEKPHLEDFTGCVVHSDLTITTKFETQDPMVNRLYLNALWGQRGNFLDVPTDCPQRDERLGWTGDAQVFSGTACFNMDSYAFFNKYLFDMWQEQQKHEGLVPHVIPNCVVTTFGVGGACAWADAATIIPMNVYQFYGDIAILEQQFDSMKAWVDCIRRYDAQTENKRLWLTGFQFGDWLALDFLPNLGRRDYSSFGGTDKYFIASAYYRYSSLLVSKAAEILGKTQLAREYAKLSEEVRSAMEEEYFTKNGRLAIPTQTAHVLALFMDIAPKNARKRIARDLVSKLEADNNHLRTGFVGTPYLCRVLSEAGYDDMAYSLFLTRDYPGWLYAVSMGATTIWERWNSVKPDHSVGDAGMNSLNHYAYGSIFEWVYRYAAGLNPVADAPGFKKALIAPRPDRRLGKLSLAFESPMGRYQIKWAYQDTCFKMEVEIPFGAQAQICLPHVMPGTVMLNGTALEGGEMNGDALCLTKGAGTYTFAYSLSRE